MSVDQQGRRAAQSLWAGAVDLHVEERLASLHREGARRTPHRLAVVGAAALVAALAVGAAVLRPALAPSEVPSGAPTGEVVPDLGAGYEVIAADSSPSGRWQAVATFRDGQTAAVVVREAGTDEQRVVWSGETPQELVRANASRPVAVSWSPDGRRLAIVTARVPYGDDTTAEEVQLLVVGRDGSGRVVVPGDLGDCACSAELPSLAWTADGRRVDVTVPRETGSDVIRLTVQ